jgi:hypothetical protein
MMRNRREQFARRRRCRLPPSARSDYANLTDGIHECNDAVGETGELGHFFLLFLSKDQRRQKPRKRENQKIYEYDEEKFGSSSFSWMK